MSVGSLFRVLSWPSYKENRPVRSIGAAELLAVGEAIDEGKILTRTVAMILDVNVPLLISQGSKDFLTCLSTHRNSIDKSFLANINVIRFELERPNVRQFTCIPYREKLAYHGNKQDSPLTDALLLALFDGRLSLE